MTGPVIEPESSTMSDTIVPRTISNYYYCCLGLFGCVTGWWVRFVTLVCCTGICGAARYEQFPVEISSWESWMKNWWDFRSDFDKKTLTGKNWKGEISGCIRKKKRFFAPDREWVISCRNSFWLHTKRSYAKRSVWGLHYRGLRVAIPIHWCLFLYGPRSYTNIRVDGFLGEELGRDNWVFFL